MSLWTASAVTWSRLAFTIALAKVAGIACSIATPAGAINTAPMWDLSCGSVEASIVEVTQDSVSVRMTLHADEARIHSSPEPSATRCNLDVVHATLALRRGSRHADEEVLVPAQPIEPLAAPPGADVSRVIEFVPPYADVDASALEPSDRDVEIVVEGPHGGVGDLALDVASP